MSNHCASQAPCEEKGSTRRDFIVLTGNAMLAVGAGTVGVALVDSMNPSKDVLALATVEVDLSPVAEGQEIKVMWQGKPVFVRHRTAAEIDEARKVDVSTLRDPQKDEERVMKDKAQWLVMIGVCTHLGCVPLGQAGEYHGWFCPCHGSHYDTSGRIRKGPAPQNLHVPKYEFLSDNRILIG